MPKDNLQFPVRGLLFLPQLSGLRFMAVLFVVVYHFSSMLMGFKWHYDLGAFIVFFFVLSSYLLTRILIDAKLNAEETGMAKWKVGVAFLIRRTLRIFPAYYIYLLILMAFVIAGAEIRQHPVIYFAYLYNFWIFITNGWGPFTVHLWTLAVEEQFYLFWPWIILITPTRWLPKLFTLMIIGAVFFRIGLLTFYPEVQQFPMLVLSPSCMDSFAAGGLLAYYHCRDKVNAKWLLTAVFIAIPVWLFLIFTEHHRTFIGLDRAFISLYTVAVIDWGIRGFRGFVKMVMENSVVLYLSKISYGIYLYHLIVPLFFWKIFSLIHRGLLERGYSLQWLENLMNSSYLSFIVYFIMAVGCASISWYFVEKPLNSLKRLFSYSMPKRKSAIQKGA